MGGPVLKSAMATQETPRKDLSVPQMNVKFVPGKAGEAYKLGPITALLVEDGSHTGTYFPSTSILNQPPTNSPSTTKTTATAPPSSSSPFTPQWHGMHNETFFETKGAIRFSTTGHRCQRLRCQTRSLHDGAGTRTAYHSMKKRASSPPSLRRFMSITLS